MAEEKKPLTEDRDGPLGKQGWHAGATFFQETGGEPARPPQAAEEREQGAGGGDGHLPASEAGTGMIPEDEEAGEPGDVHRPASEADSAGLQDERTDAPQAWPGKSFGTIPPPG